MKRGRSSLLMGVAALLVVGFSIMLFERPPRLPDLPHPALTSAPEGAPASVASVPSSDRSVTTAKPSPTSIDPARVTVLREAKDGLVTWTGAAEASAALNQPEQGPREDIQAVHTILTDYHSVFGETPPGGLNEEITRGLLGDNPKKIVFLVADSGKVNAQGELIDRWGTPYFFHKLSRDTIDLRSAGPDGKMWTSDDVFEKTEDGTQL